MTDITCRELIEFLDDYVAGELDRARREAFESHLRECQACRSYLATYRATMRLSAEAAHDAAQHAAERVPEDLVRAIMAARERG